jgi:Zn-dependent peptidase ImmA (M78 family)
MPAALDFGTRKIKLVDGPLTKDEETFFFGEFVRQGATITVNDAQEPHERMDTVLHELVHAIISIRGLDLPKRTEESVCGLLGEGLAEVFSRNPKFLKWLEAGCP